MIQYKYIAPSNPNKFLTTDALGKLEALYDFTASSIPFDNTGSGMVSTEVRAAIIEAFNAAATPDLMTVLSIDNATNGNNISISAGDSILWGEGSGGELVAPTTTSSQIWTFPDNTGTIALTVDLTLSTVLGNNNTTSGNDIVITVGDYIVSSDNTSMIISVDGVAATKGYINFSNTLTVLGNAQTTINLDSSTQEISFTGSETRIIPYNGAQDAVLKLFGGVWGTNPIIKFNAANNQDIELTAPLTPTAYTLVLPSAQGGVNEVLGNDGSGNLIWIATDSNIIDGGNSLGTSLSIGTNDAYDVVFKANNNTRVTITSVGNVILSASTYVQSNTELYVLGERVDIGNPSSQTGKLRLYNSNHNFSLTIESSSTQSADNTYTLPTDYGVAGQKLTSDGLGGLYWS